MAKQVANAMADDRPDTRAASAGPHPVGEGPAAYAAVLDAATGEGGKAERTRARLLAACARLMERPGAPVPTVAAICKAAGVAHGTFYLHFADRADCAGAVLSGFADFLRERMHAASAEPGGDPVRGATAAYVRLFRVHAGLMRHMAGGLDAMPQCRAAFQALNAQWAATVAGAMRRKAGPLSLHPDEITRRAYALGGMVDQYLVQWLLLEDAALGRLSTDEDTVIETLTTLWKKGMEP